MKILNSSKYSHFFIKIRLASSIIPPSYMDVYVSYAVCKLASNKHTSETRNSARETQHWGGKRRNILGVWHGGCYNCYQTVNRWLADTEAGNNILLFRDEFNLFDICPEPNLISSFRTLRMFREIFLLLHKVFFQKWMRFRRIDSLHSKFTLLDIRYLLRILKLRQTYLLTESCWYEVCDILQAINLSRVWPKYPCNRANFIPIFECNHVARAFLSRITNAREWEKPKLYENIYFKTLDRELPGDLCIYAG